MNILLTSSGRRVELLKLAKKTLSENGGGKVFAVDVMSDAPTSKFADAFFTLNEIGDGVCYIRDLLEICKREQVDILIPTIDTELIPIASSIEEFTEIGTLVNIPSLEVVRLCRDKTSTRKFFEENSIKTPRAFDVNLDADSLSYPLFIKPRDGSASFNAFKIKTPRELEFFREYVKKPILQEFIDGDEFTIDAFCDRDGSPIHIVPRRRISVRSGEVLKGRIEKNREIIDATRDVLTKIKLFGHTTIQCIRNSFGVYFTEINPRFGGGAPMSIMAGANSIELLLKLKNAEEISYNENWRDGVEYSRFDDAVAFFSNE